MIRTSCKLLGLLALAATGCSSEALNAGTAGSAGVEPGAGGGLGAPGAGGSTSTPAAGATSGATLQRAAYPEGPYGRGVGATIANLSFLGWRDPVKAGYDPAQLERVSLSDFYNPGGTTNDVRLIMLNASAVWCSVCKSEYRHLRNAGIYSTYRPKGVEILGILFEDNKYNPAKPSDLVVWGGNDGFNVTFPLVLDPGFKIGVYFESDATPMNMVIDATTMQIKKVTMGYNAATPDDYWQDIDSLLLAP